MTKRIFLIGHPVGHSVSPTFQQAALDHYSMDIRYEAIDVDNISLPKVVASLREKDSIGANVTVPHKETVLDLLDEVEEEARFIGAVNVIEKRGGLLVGHNTDVQGFSRAVKEHAGIDPQGKHAIVLGAGGSARAVSVALVMAGVKSLVIANRSIERARVLVERLRPLLPATEAVALNADLLTSKLAGRQLIINCTTLGMHGGIGQDETPMKAELIPLGALVCDLVYNPMKTPLLIEAARAGASTLGGLPMLVYQGAASFELWTAEKAPITVMFEAAARALAHYKK